ncbi:MAG: hypothetical protein AAF890_02410, partial [Pseudomonadota bacterium]
MKENPKAKNDRGAGHQRHNCPGEKVYVATKVHEDKITDVEQTSEHGRYPNRRHIAFPDKNGANGCGNTNPEQVKTVLV